MEWWNDGILVNLQGFYRFLICMVKMKIADKQFELHVYELAIESYKSALKLSPLNYHAMSRIAESHLKMNNIIEAEGWYKRLITMSDVDPNDILNYAHTLKKLGKYRQADIQLCS